MHPHPEASFLMFSHQNSAGQEPGLTSAVLERRPKVAEVAARAGVSTATVDRVINGRGGVHQKTVARVEEAIREIVGGDRPPAAPHAAQFDIFLPANSGRSTEVLAEAFTRGARAHGAQVALFVETHESGGAGRSTARCRAARQRGRRRAGLDHPLVREAIKELARAGIPIVTVCSDIAGVDRLAYIGVDNRAAGRTAGFLMGRFCRGARQARRGVGRPALPQPRGTRDRLPRRAASGVSRTADHRNGQRQR